MATTSDINAGNGQQLRPVLVLAQAGDTAQALAERLAIGGSAGPVILLAGDQFDAEPPRKARLIQLVGRGLLRAAKEAGALCIVRGGAGGLASLVGRAVAETDHAPPLLGVAPAARLRLPESPADGASEAAAAADDPLEAPAPGLSHLLLTPGADWGSELRLKTELAQTLAAGKPVLMVLIGGGATANAEVLQAVRRRWPVLLVKGSGGAADELVRQWLARAADDDDPAVAEILADGQLTCITLGERVAEAVETLARQVLRQSGGESVLRQAWRRFAAIDAAAIRQQSDFMRSQWRILALAVAAVSLAILHMLLLDPQAAMASAGLGFFDTLGAARDRGLLDAGRWLLEKATGLVLIVVPIGTSVMIAATNRFKPGKRWVLLRSAAEQIKREIYRYRLRAVGYDVDDTREKKLSEAVEDITRRLARTEANTTALPIHTGPIPPENAASPRDDGLSPLSTDQYVRLRLEDQLSFYRRKSVGLEVELSRLHWWVLGAGAAGTLLAAIGGSAVIWIALSTALASACMTYLGYRQVETTLVGYNQTATDLDNILSWWTALEPDEQARRDNIEALASHTEQVLADELAGWTQRMTDALEKLRDAQAKDRGDRERAEAGQAGAETDRDGRAAGGADSRATPQGALPAAELVDAAGHAAEDAAADAPPAAPAEAPAALPDTADAPARPAADPANPAPR